MEILFLGFRNYSTDSFRKSIRDSFRNPSADSTENLPKLLQKFLPGLFTKKNLAMIDLELSCQSLLYKYSFMKFFLKIIRI